MNVDPVGAYSRQRIYETFYLWHVPEEFALTFYHYLTKGFHPGGFFTAVIANDWAGAIQHSHVSNSVQSLKNLTGWIQNVMPAEARGSYDTVEKWCYHITEEQRIAILTQYRLVLPGSVETFMALKGDDAELPDLSDPMYRTYEE